MRHTLIHCTVTVDREIFAFKYFRVINVCMSNFHHKVKEVKIIHGLFYFRVFYFRVLNFRRPRERRKIFNGEYFPIYGTLQLLHPDSTEYYSCILFPDKVLIACQQVMISTKLSCSFFISTGLATIYLID